MNKCFKCGTEFEGNFCPECGTRYEETKTCPQCGAELDGRVKFCNECGYSFIERQSRPEPEKHRETSFLNTEKFKNIFYFVPVALFALWSVLLWAFYSAKVVDDMLGLVQGNLYQILKANLSDEINSQLKVFIAFGVISNVYILFYLFAQLKGQKVLKLISNIGCFVLQLVIFICTIVLGSKVTKIGLAQGNMVTVTISLTVVFAVLQSTSLLLRKFLKIEQFESKPINPKWKERFKAIFQKTKSWIVVHKALTSCLAIILVVVIVLSTVLPLTVGNIFRANRIAKINIGDSYEQVKAILGEPYAPKSNESVYNYYSSNMTKKLNQLNALSAKNEELGNLGDLVDQANKEEKLQAQIDTLEYKHISVTFDSAGKVAKVVFDKYAQNIKKDTTKRLQRVQFLPGTLPYGITPQETDLYAKVYYTDGSYQLNLLRVNSTEYSNNYWKINWSDIWGEHSSSIAQGTDLAETVAGGTYYSYAIIKLNQDNYRLLITSNIRSSDRGYPWDNYHITSVCVTEDVTFIPRNVFDSCPEIEFVQDENGIYLGSITNNYQNLWKITNTEISSFNFNPNTVTIMSNSFDGCVNLKELTIPTTVKHFGENAFPSNTENFYYAGTMSDWCNVSFNTLAENPMRYIDNFYIKDDNGNNIHKSEITEILIPGNAQTLGKYVFSGFSNASKIVIENGVERIDSYVFGGMGDLTSLYIPQSLNFFSFYAFDQDGIIRSGKKIESIEVASKNKNYSSKGNCLIFKKTKTLMFGCPNTVIPSDGSVTTINSYAFANCEDLTSIHIPKQVEYIEEYAFYNCTNLQYVTFASGSALLGIYQGAFVNCKSLKNITIPQHVAYMGGERFYYSPYSYSPFAGSGLETISVDSKNENYKSVNNCVIDIRTKTLIVGCKNSIIPTDGSVTTIGGSAFEGSEGLTNLTIPQSITTIESYAFANCNGIKNVTIPSTITEVGYGVFSGCSNLETVNWNTNCKVPTSVDDTDYIVENMDIITIFQNCPKFTKVIFGENVQQISAFTFANCTSLENVIFANNNHVVAIGRGAFYNCTGLTNFTIKEEITSIGAGAFFGCENLTSVIFENPNGWRFNRYPIDEQDLNDPEEAANWLTDAWYSEWTRS